MSRSAVEYVRHILDETGYLMDRAQGLTWDQFMRDETLKRAFVRSLEIIGEASKKIPDDFKQKYGHLEWRAMAGMRDRLIHGYFGVDYGIVPVKTRPTALAPDAAPLRCASRRR
ncbi:HepT-like ribonuclease domain-containing protein [Roseiflexus sp.]